MGVHLISRVVIALLPMGLCGIFSRKMVDLEAKNRGASSNRAASSNRGFTVIGIISTSCLAIWECIRERHFS